MCIRDRRYSEVGLSPSLRPRRCTLAAAALCRERKPRLVSILEAQRPMKSHPDAGTRSAAEVVTQLPVPSRLGMLRFERLNEPSWALLFLDPACERKLGISAADLCALVDAPYALSLIHI